MLRIAYFYINLCYQTLLDTTAVIFISIAYVALLIWGFVCFFSDPICIRKLPGNLDSARSEKCGGLF